MIRMQGFTTGDIQAQFVDIYDTTISRDTNSKITDATVDELREWLTHRDRVETRRVSTADGRAM